IMIGFKRTGRLCSILLLFALILPFGKVCAGYSSQINSLEEQQKQLQYKGKEMLGDIAELKLKAADTLATKAALDQRNELARQELQLVYEQIELYEKLVSEKSIELQEAKAAVIEQKDKLRKRIRFMEEQGRISYLSVLLKANSFSDLLGKIYDIGCIMEYDKKLEESFIAAKENAEKAKAEYVRAQNEQLAKKQEQEEKKIALEKEIQAATAIVFELEKDIEKYKKDYEENSLIEAAVRNQISELSAKMLEEEQNKKGGQENNPSLDGSSEKTQGFVWPVPSCKAKGDGFGPRFHPIFKEMRPHRGLDIPGAAGAEIVAIGSGTVQFAQYNGSFGNYVVVYHHSGIASLYAHMSGFAVSPGDPVSQGQTLGYVGSTGWSTGPHLHIEIAVNSTPVNPESYISP
ncbi:MAG: peptidoglycan DD-metalloendopeptidase family protein, partial [Oscillospiraceae bacterium]